MLAGASCADLFQSSHCGAGALEPRFHVDRGDASMTTGDFASASHPALSGLSDRQRSVIVLHDIEGFKHAEIGTMLGIPEGTARSDLHHARAALRRILGAFRSDL